MPEQPATERTEQPTPRRLRKAKEQGQVPQSMELASVVSLVLLVASGVLLAPHFMRWISLEMKQGFSCGNHVFANADSFMAFINGKLTAALLLICPILAALLVGSIISGVALSGPTFSPKALKLNFKAINPVKGFGNLFNAKSGVKLLASVFKLLFVGVIAWFYIKSKTDDLAALRWSFSSGLLSAIGKLVLGLMIRVCIALLIIAVGDALYQRHKHISELKMTRQEVKDEHKETDGSPQVKSRIRQIQYQMALNRIAQEVPKADVVLTNPTHFAVALKYDAKTMDAPVMLAKGADHMAERIREIARSNGIPVLRRPELTRSIYSGVKPGQAVPNDLYVAVAEVLALIYRLKKQRTS